MAEKTKHVDVIHLPLARISNRLLRNLLLLLQPVLEWLLGLPKINATHRDAQAMDATLPFADRVLRVLGVTYAVTDEDRAVIPAKGPVVVVANHPFGGIEGMVLARIPSFTRTMR